jgi:hypothetical protein
LIRRAEQDLDADSRSAGRTLERARRALVRQRDAEGLEHLLGLAERLDKPGNLTYAIQQNLAFLARQAQDRPRRPASVAMGVVGALAGLIGGVGGMVGGIALTYPILSGGDPSGLVYLAGWIFFGFVGAVLGAGLGYGFWRLAQWFWRSSAGADD